MRNESERLVDIAGDAEAAMHGLDEAIQYLSKRSRVYPQLYLAKRVCERIWLAACNEPSSGDKDG